MAQRIVVLDESNMLEKINELPLQLEKAWTNLWTKDLPIDTSKIDHVLITGMGGSGIAGVLAAELFMDSPTPITVLADYNIPGWVNERTLFIPVSYSGDTEETINATNKALEKKAQIVVITSGGKLHELAAKYSLPEVVIAYKSAPRAALGWLYGSLLTLLAKCKIIDLTEVEYFSAIAEIKEVVEGGKFIKQAENLVISLVDKTPYIMSYAPLVSVTRRFVTQFNENSKTFAVNAPIPEFCHNAAEGLDFGNGDKLQVLFLESNFAFSRNLLRRKIIEKVFHEKNVSFVPISVKAKSPLSEQLLLIHLGDLLSYYLAGIYGIDPSVMTTINYIKDELIKA